MAAAIGIHQWAASRDLQSLHELLLGHGWILVLQEPVLLRDHLKCVIHSYWVSLLQIVVAVVQK